MNVPQVNISEVRLTSLAHGGGCGCKLAPSVLQQLLSTAPKQNPFQQLLVGIETGDDAAVWQVDDNTCIIATTDFQRAVPDQIARFVPRRYASLGTDGFGRSDTRDALRRFFETDVAHVVLAVLTELVAEGALVPGALTDAIARYGVQTELPPPWVD